MRWCVFGCDWGDPVVPLLLLSRTQELEPNDVERLCESGGLRLGFVPAGALSVQRPGADGGEGAVVEETTDEDVLADGDMDAEEAAAMREKLNKLFQSGGGSL